MWTRAGKRKEMGLGSFSTGTATVSLAVARKKAEEIRGILGEGGDPFTDMAERQSRKRRLTFGQAADDLIEAKATEWTNPKHRQQWEMTLREYAKPLRNKSVDEIDVEDIVRTLKPIWTTKAETARRTRMRIERVLDHAAARGMRSGDNPARWQGHLDHLLPKQPKLSRGHHAALPYAEVPSLMGRLSQRADIGARALELLILTATRTGETIGARWDEIDLTEKTWTVPAERTKTKREHRIPLTAAALAVIQSLRRFEGSPFLFPGRNPQKHVSNMTMNKQLERLEIENATVHGFRSSFRDWAGEETSFPREVAEQALAHNVGNAVELAYRRGDALEKRRKLMDAWAAYLHPVTNGVVKLHG